jgi:hypothetical protein
LALASITTVEAATMFIRADGLSLLHWGLFGIRIWRRDLSHGTTKMVENSAMGQEALSTVFISNDIHKTMSTQRGHARSIQHVIAAPNSNARRGFRVLGIAAAIIGLELAMACCLGTTVAEGQQRDIYSVGDDGESTAQPLSLTGSETANHPDRELTEGQARAIAASDMVLSAQAKRVSEIAEHHGDKVFLLVDKALGEIFLFENGKPTVSGTALTGAGMGDRIPAKVLTYSDLHPLTVEEKVTPAGRFTVTQEFDKEYGWTLTLNEIHGKDWDFAIHQMYLGIPSEHRDARIHSLNAFDRHITFGCINVERSTILLLAHKLPRKGKTPLYILPQDAAMTDFFFPLHVSAVARKAQAQ